MNVELERRALAIFEEVCALDEPGRERRLGELAAGDGALVERVRALLRGDGTADGFLESPLPRAGSSADPGLFRLPAEGERLGSYVLERCIGRGGMGAVYEAVQESPRRTVALKVVRPELLGEQTRKRFHHEAEILAHLSHPGIAQVHDAGIATLGSGSAAREVPYFVMEFVPGARTLLEHADAEGLDVERRLELFVAVCRAVQHGHQKGIVHRDLKPSNLLVGADGAPRVIDFGIARATRDTDADLFLTAVETQPGQFLGTLQYVSPEQLEGAPYGPDTRSDVYSLGVVLHELLCGRRPYDVSGKSLPEAIRLVREASPPRLALPRDLEAIVLRALSKEPERRYASAAALADDLERFLRREPVEAHPPSRTYQLRLFARRHRLLVSASAVVLVVSVAAAIVSLRFAADARAALAEANALEAELLDYGEAIVFQAVDDLKRLGVGTGALADLARDAVARMESLEARAGDDPEVARSLAASLVRFAHLLGNPWEPNLGDEEGAWDGYHRALALVENQLASRPDDPFLRRIRARAELGIADLMYARGELEDSVARSRAALAVLEELSREWPDDVEVRRDLGDAYYSMGSTLHADFDTALEYLDRAEAVFEDLVDAEANARHDRRRLGAVFFTRGATRFVLADADAGLEDLERSVELWQALADEDSTDLEARSKAVQARNELSLALWTIGLHDGALAELEQMERALGPLRAQDPANALLLKMELNVHLNRGMILLARLGGDPATGTALDAARTARASLERAQALLDEIADDPPAWYAAKASRLRQSRDQADRLLAAAPGGG